MLIVNPNFTTDRTIPLDILAPGSVQRTGRPAVTLGGKGVNVARVARALGDRALLLGFMPAASEALLDQLGAEEGAELTGVPVAGAVRAASILLERSGRVTVLNEPGPDVDADAWRRLLAEVERRAPEHETVVCSGSLPPGSPVDAYARVVAVARRAGVRSVVDATGEVLAAALSEHPDLVSPNLAEAESLVLGHLAEPVEPSGGRVAQRATEAARSLVAGGARSAVVSAGSHGAAFAGPTDGGFRRAPAVTVVNPVGAGDSLVGGLVHALERGRPWDDALTFALAVASASCEQERAGAIDVIRVNELVGDPGREREQPGRPADRQIRS